MNKISIIGLNREKPSLIKDIMDLGVVEVSSQESKLTDPEWISNVKKDGNESKVLNFDVKISELDEVLASLDKYDTRNKPLISTRKTITSEEFDKILNTETADENVSQVLKLNDSLNKLISEKNKFETAVLSLKPWSGYDLPLDLNKTKYTNVLKGTMPSVVQIEKVIRELEEKISSCYYEVIGSDKDQHYVSIICLTREKEEVYDVLKQYGFNTISFKDLKGTAAENIVQCEERLKEITDEKEIIEKKAGEIVQYKKEIQILYDHLIIERDKTKILSNILKTDSTFYIEGWIPKESIEDVKKIIERYQCWYEIKEPEEGEDFPVALYNNSFAQPFESITELYSLPSSSNIDPTSIMAPFYCIFFGLMLADIGYGLIMAIACYVVLKKFKLEGTMQKMIKMFFYCGISTAFWGVMFGSWFGDAVAAAAKLIFNCDLNIKPLWINPMEEPMTLLIFSFVFGAIHLFTGMALQARLLIRDDKKLDALFDIGFWYGFIIGIALWLFGNSIIPGSGSVGKWMTIIFAIGLILTQGRDKKNILSKLTSGVMSLYDITGYLSDILSYSRLLALGLATGVISSVLSILGSMGGRNFFGILLFFVVFLIGHTLNFAINALGAFVHAARLQYVEFFGKFYEGGGESFNPLIKKTKYNKIIKEEV